MESYGLLTAKGGVTKVYPDLDVDDAGKQKRTIRIEYCTRPSRASCAARPVRAAD